MYPDEIYTVGEMFLLCLMTGTIGYMLASNKYQKRVERERKARNYYKYLLNKERGVE
jgi:hypothetical protein